MRYVLDRHLARRHLDETARAVAAYRLSQWSTPGRLRVEQGNGANLHRFSQDEAAERMAVSRRSVNYAGKVLSEDRPATAELRQALEEGLVRASDAAGVAENRRRCSSGLWTWWPGKKPAT